MPRAGQQSDGKPHSSCPPLLERHSSVEPNGPGLGRHSFKNWLGSLWHELQRLSTGCHSNSRIGPGEQLPKLVQILSGSPFVLHIYLRVVVVVSVRRIGVSSVG